MIMRHRIRHINVRSNLSETGLIQEHIIAHSWHLSPSDRVSQLLTRILGNHFSNRHYPIVVVPAAEGTIKMPRCRASLKILSEPIRLRVSSHRSHPRESTFIRRTISRLLLLDAFKFESAARSLPSRSLILSRFLYSNNIHVIMVRHNQYKAVKIN